MAKQFRNTLRNHAILVDFSGGWFNWNRRDTKVEGEVATSHSVSRNAGKFLKNMFYGSDLPLHTIRQLVQRARADHDLHTVQWEPGRRLLRTVNYTTYVKVQQHHQSQLFDAKKDLEAQYPSMIAQAQQMLGSLFNARDYPSVHDVISACYIDYKFIPFSDASDVRLELDDEIVDEIKSQVAATQNEQFAEAVNSVWLRFHDLVEQATRNLGKNLGDAKATGERFSSTWYDQLKDFLPCMKGLNLTDDPRLDALAKRCNTLLTFDEEELKVNKSARADTYQQAQAIYNDLSAIFSPQTGVK